MMNRSMQLNHSAALTLCSESAWSIFVSNAASFFSRLFFCYYCYFSFMLPSKRKLIW